MAEHYLTIFTPSYNRAYIIGNLYESLKAQTSKNFEWLIVDDGSTDNTKELIESFIADKNDFIIRYYFQKNGGKHRATNKGVSLAEGDLFMVVDSDDTLTSDAVEKIYSWFSQIPENGKFAGVVANKGTSSTETVNNLFSDEYIDSTFLYAQTKTECGKKILNGERAVCIYTELYRKYPYPEFENEKFVTEAVSYNRMAHDGYKARYYNDIIYIFEYREDGYTMTGNKLFTNNPYGYGLWLKEKCLFTDNTLKSRLKLYYTFTCELSELYDIKTIAQCIDIKVTVIAMCRFLHKIKYTLKKHSK